MTKPTIHLNGTSRNDLYEAYYAAFRAVDEAVQVLHKSGPNGRDYYLQGASAINTAVQEHRSRIERLEAVREELLQLTEACSE